MRLRFAFVLFLPCLMAVALADDLTGKVQLSSGRAAGSAVVYLEGGPKPMPLAHYTVDQRDREFIPHVSVVPVGTTVDFPNNDTVFHNVFAEYQAKRFDLGMYPRGTSKHQRFDKPGLVAMLCSVHSEMGAYIMVVDSSYYTVADGKGRFTIKNVAPGTYTLRVWHECGETSSQKLTITGSNQNLEVRTSRQ